MLHVGDADSKTANRLRAVEELETGDLIDTLDHGYQPLGLVLNRTVKAQGAFAPIVFPKGSCGNARDLVVSPQHRLLFDGPRCELFFGCDEVLVAATHLANAGFGYRRTGGDVTYFHLVLDDHEIIYAEGTPTESFLPSDVKRLDHAAVAEFETLFPHHVAAFATKSAATRMCLKSHETAILMA